jgi:general secretion pathway protein K
MRSTGNSRGSALLMVLWATAALAAITLTLANTVRSEAERAITGTDALRASYLASAAIDRALLWIQWGNLGVNRPHSDKRYYEAPSPVMRMEFPEGDAVVEVIPELSKLNINTASVEDLTRLIAAAGEPRQAEAIAAGIVDWRSGPPDGSITAFDAWYMSRQPSFRSPHASFQEIEELLLVRGMTPELFYGGYTHDATGHAVPYGGLRDCLSVYGGNGPFDVNTVRPQILLALGLSPEAVAQIVSRRGSGVIRSMGDLGSIAGSPAMSRLNVSDVNTGTIWTLRATARTRLPDGTLSRVQHSAAASIKFFPPNAANPPWHILRWYDDTPRLEGAGMTSVQ